MKIFLLVITVLIGLLQYRLWYGNGGVKDLRKGKEAIEERARYELGMMKEGETFFQVLE